MTASFISQLAEAGRLAPSADNSQPCKMRWDGRELALCHVARHTAYNVFGAGSHATLLSVGAMMENLDTALAANGVNAAWRWGGELGQPYAALGLPPVLPQHCLLPAGLLERHTSRLPFQRRALPPELLEQLGAETAGDNRVRVLTGRDTIGRLVQIVRLAAEARFCNRELHHWLFGSLRLTADRIAAGDGLDINSLGLPPGGKQFMAFIADWRRMERLNRLGLYKLLALSEIRLISAAPALLCISGGGHWRSVIDAGRLMTRVWTTLNTHGIAVQPYYVVTDQLNRLHSGTLAPGFAGPLEAAEQPLRTLLDLAPDRMLHMILRVGYPTAPAVRSRRLPLASVFEDASA